MKDIYELKLNEVQVISETPHNHSTPTKTTVTRVPGGWIYKTYQSIQVGDNVALTSNAVFVPYNDEFKTKSSPNLSDPLIG
jgi:hypothetical protein